MKSYNIIVCFVFILFIGSFSACQKSYYVSKDFKKTTQNHTSIAIMPVQMIFTGSILGAALSDTAKIEVEEAESKAFQISLFRELLYSSNSGKKQIWVNLMPVEQTNKVLAEKGISIRQSWEMTADELAELLGVDAVIKTQVYKQQYLTDLASYGINIGSKVLALLTKGRSLLAISGRKLDRTTTITAHCTLYNQKDASVLWSMSLQEDTDFNSPTNEVIDNINKQFAKNFPYRGKRK